MLVTSVYKKKTQKTNAVYFYSPKIEISKELIYYDNAIPGDYRLEKKIVIEILFYCATDMHSLKYTILPGFV